MHEDDCAKFEDAHTIDQLQEYHTIILLPKADQKLQYGLSEVWPVLSRLLCGGKHDAGL